MSLTLLGGDCGRDDCPSIHATDRGTIIVTGNPITDEPGLAVSAGESAVEIPSRVFEEAARATGR